MPRVVARLQPSTNQFDLFSLLLLPFFLAVGFVIAYAALVWTYWAADQIGYYSLSILFRLPTGFGESLFHLPGITCLYVLVTVLGMCRHPFATLAGWVLIGDWVFAVLSLSNLTTLGLLAPLGATWRSMLLIAFAVVPMYWGRSLSYDMTVDQIHRVRSTAIIGLAVFAILAFVGFHAPPKSSTFPAATTSRSLK
jgi:hypothetical protein